MKILVDADACPKPVKEILQRAVERVGIEMIFVANQYIPVQKNTLISSIKVGQGADKADDKIVELVDAGDLVISADIPLADRVVEKNGFVLTPHGTFLTEENIKQKLSMRNFMDELRSSGVATGGFAPYNNKHKQLFASRLDQFLTKHLS